MENISYGNDGPVFHPLQKLSKQQQYHSDPFVLLRSAGYVRMFQNSGDSELAMEILKVPVQTGLRGKNPSLVLDKISSHNQEERTTCNGK